MAGQFDIALPTGKELVDGDRYLSLAWTVWFEKLVRAIGSLTIYGPSAAYDPPSLTSGASVSVSMTTPGTKIGDFALASFSASQAGITVKADIVADDATVVTITNQTGSTVDLASGTLSVLRVGVL